jgi:hypothetical protein
MADLHNILFNMQALYSLALGIYAGILGAQEKPLSGNFWGSVAVYVILNIVVLAIGVFLWASGFTIASDGRIIIYLLYMAFLIVIMPGLFSMLRGRDDRSAAIAFAVLALFNASVSLSMAQRGLASWVLPAA